MTPPGETRVADGGGGGLPRPAPLPPRAADLGGRRRCPAVLAVWREVAGLGERWRGAGHAAAGLGRWWRLRAGLTLGRRRRHGSIADLVYGRGLGLPCSAGGSQWGASPY